MSTDRTRRFVLPGIQDLNKDQDAALALPEGGQHLVIGGPGTGKSVVTLLRARRLLNAKMGFRFLVYNRLLATSNRYLFGSEEITVSTWDQWFRKLWENRFKSGVPCLSALDNSTYRPIDWGAATQWLNERADAIPPLKDSPTIVIDEGQDMPPAFYNALAQIGFENFYVAADQNQQIHPDKCSSRQDIENALATETSATLELTRNYRNTRPIAMLARHFYPDDPASPRPDLPAASASAMRPEMWVYGNGRTLNLAGLAGRTLQLSDRNPRKLIGIITPDNATREKFCEALRAAHPPLDNDAPPIQTYANGHDAALRFDQGGVMIINAQSCKGLEFDTVILADIDSHRPAQADILKARFYVMVSRARDQVILLRTGPASPVVDAMLPTDPAVLARG
ncbi:MAG: ATP-binding domain-containing protein [Xanthomonadales bacterium]|nr:ATP-binding domain-containing protein [Xanthomonadales bacterium]